MTTQPTAKLTLLVSAIQRVIGVLWLSLRVVVAGTIATVVIGTIIFMFFVPSDEKSNYKLLKSIESGSAIAQEWKEYNDLLRKEAQSCFENNLIEQTKLLAWNPSSIRLEYPVYTQLPNADTNRLSNWSGTGGGYAYGTNAFGGTVRNYVRATFTVRPSFDDSARTAKLACEF